MRAHPAQAVGLIPSCSFGIREIRERGPQDPSPPRAAHPETGLAPPATPERIVGQELDGGDLLQRLLKTAEGPRFLEPMRSPFREIGKLAALTLMRQGEVRLLRREMVHLEQGG